MTRIVVKLREWKPGDLPDILSACGAERIPDHVVVPLRWAMGSVADGADVEAVLAALRAHPAVERAWLNVGVPSASRHAAYHLASADANIDDAWNLKRMNVFHAWRTTRGSAAVKQGVVDDGWAYHPDLPAIAPGNGEDMWHLDGDPTHPDVMADGAFYCHGSWVLSVMAALRGNGVGAAGLAPDCPPVFVADLAPPTPGFEDYEFIADPANDVAGIIEAVDRGARVVNASWAFGTHTWNPYQMAFADVMVETQAAIDYAWANNCLVVIAAGNGNQFSGDPIPQSAGGLYYNVAFYKNWPAGTQENASWPQCVPNDRVLIVGGIRADDEKWGTWTVNEGGSNYGPLIDICAPGQYVALASRTPDSLGYRFHYGTGTSFAAPAVTATIALALSVNPALTAEQTRALIMGSADRSFGATFNARFPSSAGVLNAGRAVARARATLGEVVPYFAAWKRPPYATFQITDPAAGWTRTTTEGPWSLITVSPATGVATTTLDGEVAIDLTGYRYDAAAPSLSSEVSEVELRLGSTVLYSGPPARLTGTASSSGTAQPVTVVARSGLAETVETYDDVIVASLALTNVPATSHTLRASAAGVEATATLAPGADVPASRVALSVSAPSLSAAPSLPTSATAYALTAPSISAAPVLPTSAIVTTFVPPEILSPDTGHRIRAVAGAFQAVTQLVPGADLPSSSTVLASPAPSLSAAPVVPTSAVAVSVSAPAIWLPLPTSAAVVSFAAPAISAELAVPTSAVAFRLRAPTIVDGDASFIPPAPRRLGRSARPWWSRMHGRLR